MKSLKAYTPFEYMELIGNAVERAMGEKDCLIVFFGSLLSERFKLIERAFKEELPEGEAL